MTESGDVGGAWSGCGGVSDFVTQDEAIRLGELFLVSRYVVCDRRGCGASPFRATLWPCDNVVEIVCEHGHVRKLGPRSRYSPLDCFRAAQLLIEAHG